jgi:hypothetical protein
MQNLRGTKSRKEAGPKGPTIIYRERSRKSAPGLSARSKIYPADCRHFQDERPKLAAHRSTVVSSLSCHGVEHDLVLDGQKVLATVERSKVEASRCRWPLGKNSMSYVAQLRVASGCRLASGATLLRLLPAKALRLKRIRVELRKRA